MKIQCYLVWIHKCNVLLYLDMLIWKKRINKKSKAFLFFSLSNFIFCTFLFNKNFMGLLLQTKHSMQCKSKKKSKQIQEKLKWIWDPKILSKKKQYVWQSLPIFAKECVLLFGIFSSWEKLILAIGSCWQIWLHSKTLLLLKLLFFVPHNFSFHQSPTYLSEV